MAEEPRTTLTDGRQVYPEHRNLRPDGMQNDYVVLAEEERAKGFVRPVRRSYKHLKCGTFCCGCGTHFPVGVNGQFVWAGTDEKVGT